jgi:hypothetical protein
MMRGMNTRQAVMTAAFGFILAGLCAARAEAQEGGNVMVLLPAESDTVDSVTLQVIDGALEEEVVEMGYTVMDKTTVADARPGSCLSMSCSETVDFLELGKNLNAHVVLHTKVKKFDADLTLSLASYGIESGSVKAASKTIKASALLTAVKTLVGDVVVEAGPPPMPPQPGKEPDKPPPETPPVETPEKPAGEETAKEAGKPGEGIAPPGELEGEGKQPPPAEKPAEEKKEGEKEEKKKEKPDQKGRVPVIVTSGILAMALGAGILLAADVDDWRIYLPVILLGGAAGVVISLVSTMKYKVTKGDAAMFDAVIAWSLINGLLIPGAAGSDEVSKFALGGTIGGTIGLAGAITIAALMDPYPGDALLLSIAGFWGAAYAEMITGLALPDDGNKYFIAGLVGLDIGLLAGGLMSIWLDVSPIRSGVITLVGLGGAALGALAGVAFVAKDDPSDQDWRVFTGITLAGTTLGLVAGVFISSIVEQKMKEKKKKKVEEGKAQALMPFLVYHDMEGWGMGMPALTPLMQGKSVGAHASLLGGVF